MWPVHAHSRLIVLKTFAPMTGLVINEDTLKLSPIFTNKIQIVEIHTKSNLVLPIEIQHEKTLEQLKAKLIDCF